MNCMNAFVVLMCCLAVGCKTRVANNEQRSISLREDSSGFQEGAKEKAYYFVASEEVYQAIFDNDIRPALNSSKHVQAVVVDPSDLDRPPLLMELLFDPEQQELSLTAYPKLKVFMVHTARKNINQAAKRLPTKSGSKRVNDSVNSRETLPQLKSKTDRPEFESDKLTLFVRSSTSNKALQFRHAQSKILAPIEQTAKMVMIGWAKKQLFGSIKERRALSELNYNSNKFGLEFSGLKIKSGEKVDLRMSDGLVQKRHIISRNEYDPSVPKGETKVILYFGGSGGPGLRDASLLAPNLLGRKGQGESIEGGFFKDQPAEIHVLEHRGFGGSEGVPSEQALYSDSLKVYDDLIAQGYKEENIVLYGFSFGGAVAAGLARQLPDSTKVRVVLDRPLTSVADAVEGHGYPKSMGHLSSRWLGNFDAAYEMMDRQNTQVIVLRNASPEDPMSLGVDRIKAWSRGKENVKFLETKKTEHDHQPLVPDKADAFYQEFSDGFGAFFARDLPINAGKP